MTQYSVLRILSKLIAYRFKAKTVHQLHSPFVFHLVQDCLKHKFPEKYTDIRLLRQELKRSQTVLEFNDYGKDGQLVRKTISTIAKTSLKPRKYAELLAKLSRYFKVEHAVELGSSLGITSSYIARNINGKLYTFEGGAAVLDIAEQNWKRLEIENIKPYLGPFAENIKLLEQTNHSYDLIFIDGHHQHEPTLAYFKHLIKVSNNETVFVFDDIHWSSGMEKAWEEIKNMAEVRCTIDLFFVGLVFLKKELSKEDFIVKY